MQAKSSSSKSITMLRYLPVPGGLPGSARIQIVRAVARRRQFSKINPYCIYRGCDSSTSSGSVGYFPVDTLQR